MFVAGFAAALNVMIMSADARARDFEQSMAGLRGKAYREWRSGFDEKIANFDPSKSDAMILEEFESWGVRSGLRLEDDGNLVSITKSGERTLRTLEPEQCKAIFQRFLSSGIVDYSEGVVELKKDLDDSGSHTIVSDGTHCMLQIRVTELGIDKRVKIYEPESEASDYPDIIEFRIFIDLLKELRGLVPPGDPDWF